MNRNKKLALILILLFTILPGLSFAQSPNSSEAGYALEKQEPDSNGRYVRTYRRGGSGHRLLKVYLDSAYTDLLSKTFYNDSFPDGPIVHYFKGKVTLEGTYKNGKWDGERRTYSREVLVQKAYHNNGVRSGTWEEYSSQGLLKRKITHDVTGKVTADVRY